MAITSLQNPGLIPIEAVTTMGVSVKEGDNPIGFFGTGLKYAIACLLRTGHKIVIWRGLVKYEFRAITAAVRGKDFDFVEMVDDTTVQRLGFTTHLGAHWEPWQVFRELYSNMLDEAGHMAHERLEPLEGHTTILVTGEVFSDCAYNVDRYFLKTQPLYENPFADVHSGKGFGLYYRGVLVSKTDAPTAFTYNLKQQMQLTEDRTLKDLHHALYYITYALCQCGDPRVVEGAVTNISGFEKQLQFSHSNVQPEFAEIVLGICEARGPGAILPSPLIAVERWAQRDGRVKAIDLNWREQKEVDDALAFLAELGYPVTAPIVVAETLGPDVFGMMRNKTIFLSRTTINRGGNFLIGTILEEHLHLSQGFEDESRSFQDFLIDLVIKIAKDGAGQPLPRPAPAEQPIAAAPQAPAPDLEDEIPF